MGKIVKNGVTYSSSSDNADNVKYNNNVSNLDATNVQEAITEVNGKLSNLIKSKTVTTNTFSVPSDIPLSKPIVSCQCDYTGIGLMAFPTNRGGTTWSVDVRKVNDWSLNDISTTITVTYLDI